MNLNELLKDKIVFFDGAMGTMLQTSGKLVEKTPELMNMSNPELIMDIHMKYLQAGSDIISTNTFGAFSFKYDSNNLFERVTAAGVENALAAIEHSGFDGRLAALSVGPTGRLIEPYGDMSFEECVEIYRQTAVIGEKSGVNLAIIETMTDIYELKAAVIAFKENTSLPLICSMTFDEKGKTMTGSGVAEAAAIIEGLGADVLGINCGLGPVQLEGFIDELLRCSSKPVIVQPNAGLPIERNGQAFYDVDAQSFALHMKGFAEKGASILGGCCGTTPDYIREMKNLNMKPVSREINDYTVVSSASKAVTIGEKTVIIGERINPTGKKKLKEALMNQDFKYILNEAVLQCDNGADILDVNVGLPDIDEADIMIKAIGLIQSAVNAPLQIDSSTPAVIENALRLYNGKAMVNSVNGKRAVMEAVFPAVKKYGGVVVGLTIDEEGIPPTAEGRLEIARRIVETAEQYGIERKNIVIDTLTMTVSAQQEQAMETIRALKLVREELNVKTVLGVSNISFGLPERLLINTSFLTLAMFNGLNACIINPLSKPMLDAVKAYGVLSGTDMGCREYINHIIKPEAAEQNQNELYDCIVNGYVQNTFNCAEDMLKYIKPMELIDSYIIPALDETGRAYEQKKVFLPQLIMSAEAAKKAFEAVAAYIKASGEVRSSRGDIVIATVKGDIHDIGKNIVKALLENYGFNIIDLGRDVEIDDILSTVKQHDIKLLGLSALMTTTVVNMEKTIKEVRKQSPECKIMVGGAVLNEAYAIRIGADFYGKDAMASVGYAQKIFS